MRSVAGKCVSLSEHIIKNSVGILALTETWLKSVDDPLLNDLVPPGYKFIGAARPTSKGSRGGGVGFVIKSDLYAETPPQCEYNSFESFTAKLKTSHPVTIALLYPWYRPPLSPKNGLTAAGLFRNCRNTFHSYVHLFQVSCV